MKQRWVQTGVCGLSFGKFPNFQKNCPFSAFFKKFNFSILQPSRATNGSESEFLSENRPQKKTPCNALFLQCQRCRLVLPYANAIPFGVNPGQFSAAPETLSIRSYGKKTTQKWPKTAFFAQKCGKNFLDKDFSKKNPMLPVAPALASG